MAIRGWFSLAARVAWRGKRLRRSVMTVVEFHSEADEIL